MALNSNSHAVGCSGIRQEYQLTTCIMTFKLWCITNIIVDGETSTTLQCVCLVSLIFLEVAHTALFHPIPLTYFLTSETKKHVDVLLLTSKLCTSPMNEVILSLKPCMDRLIEATSRWRTCIQRPRNPVCPLMTFFTLLIWDQDCEAGRNRLLSDFKVMVAESGGKRVQLPRKIIKPISFCLMLGR